MALQKEQGRTQSPLDKVLADMRALSLEELRHLLAKLDE